MELVSGSVLRPTVDIQELLRLMVERGASDLHLKVPGVPVLRIDGRLVPLEGHAPLTPEALEAMYLVLADERQRRSFAEELELDFAYSVPGLARFRVNASSQRGTLRLAIRLVPLQVRTAAELGLPQACLELVLRPRGLVLVTGPTGSGKSTTLAAMIDYLNERETRHIVTIEDPIEYLHRDKQCLIAQRELGADTLSFAAALKHALRQDPDVILLGEMRDLETIATALTAAETGHLVLGTLHTTSAPQSVDRLVDVFPAGQQEMVRTQLSLVLEGVISQTLLPRLGGGRVAAFEVLLVSGAVRNLIREGKSYQIPTIMQLGGAQGMQTLDQALAALVRQHLVAPEEALARAQSPQELRRLLQR